MLLDLFELASNKTLEHDPQTLERLAKLQGKTMTLKIKSIGQSLSITPYQEGLEFSHEAPAKVDVTLSATLGAMIKISRDGMDNAELEPGELEIAGDPIVGQRFAQVIAELNIDWEALLAEHIGDSPAKAVTYAAGQAKVFAGESKVKLKEFLNTLIKDDMQLVADKAEVEGYLDEVDIIRADVDRLNARLERLKTKV
ncbi:MAG: ubiquinone biosynthesis protein UbiJ [Arenicella sp.]|jgi:ubiquinone biosynthesis protein UbiJ